MILIAIATILIITVLALMGGVLLAFVVQVISRFFEKNLPVAPVVAGASTRQTASVKDEQIPMEKVQPQDSPTDTPEMDVTTPSSSLDGLFNTLGKSSRYIALLAAWIATCGSLYMSEVLGWIPCLLCWYQRILMYPLALILPVGILRRDKGLHKYVLALSLPGACVSLYHYLVQKVPGMEALAPCKIGVPCTSDYLNWLGFITIPFLALTAFLIISFMVIASTLAQEEPAEQEIEEDEDEAEEITTPQPVSVRARPPVLSVLAVIAAVVVSFVVAGVLYARSAPQSEPDASTTASVPIITGTGSLARGQELYVQTCAQCHGADGSGVVAGLTPLSASSLLHTGTDAQLLAFLQAGRSTNDAHNMTGIAMPAKGGRTDLSDADLVDIIAYLHVLVKK